jgi:hypothetical protein
LLALSLDISKGSGKSLSQVTDSISKALGGNMTALARLSPEVKQMVKDQKSLDEILQALGKTYKGAASTAANTFQGRMERLKVAINETKESIGYALMPIFETMVAFIESHVLPVIQKFVDSIGEKGLSKALKDSAKDMFNWYRELDGAAGAITDLTTAMGLLYGVFKAFSGLTAAIGVLQGLSTALGGLSAFGAGVGAAGLGTLSAVLGLLVINLAAFISLLRDKDSFAYAVAAVKDFASLIANIFIKMANAIVDAANLAVKAANLLAPGSPFAELPQIGYFDVNRTMNLQNGAPTVANPSNYKDVGVTSITVNTGVGDKVAIAKEIADLLSLNQRRTGSALAR